MIFKKKQKQEAIASPKEENFFIEIIKFALLAAVIVIPFRMFVAEPYIVQGESMSPTFETGHYLIINKFSHKLGEMDRGSVVVFRYPNDPSRFFVKRVIGLPGETLRIRDREVYVKPAGATEFEKLEEDYLKNTIQNNLEKDIASDEYFVAGDNRGNSHDSRAWGPLNKSFVKGEAFIRLFPLSEISITPGKTNPLITKEN